MLMLVAAAGCGSVVDQHAFVNPGRSTVLPTPTSGGALAWYSDRNDYQRSVLAGYELAEYAQSANRTYDRQQHHRGQVHDSFWSSTVNQRVIRTTK